MTAPQETFAAWLVAERARTGMSQDKLAAALQQHGHTIRQTQISRIERNARELPLAWAVAIVEVFGATLDLALGMAVSDAEARTVAARRTGLLFELKAAITDELAVRS
jgi:transcriptional regulator with XRE-family HTH domain